VRSACVWGLPPVNSRTTTSSERLRLPALPDGAGQVVNVEPQGDGDRQDGRERGVPRLPPLQGSERARREPRLEGDMLLAQCGTEPGTPDVPTQTLDEIVKLHARQGTANGKCIPGHMMPETCCSNAGTRLPSQDAHGDRAVSVREPGAVMKRIVSKVAVTALLVLLSGCTDKAQPFFDTCVQAETAGDLTGAVKTCTDAVGADPNSKSGKAATEKLVSLKERIAAKEKADAEAKAKLVGACKSRDTGAGDPTSCLTLGLVDLASEDDAVQAKAEGPLTKACNGGAGKACYELARKLSEIRAAALTPSAAMKLAMDKAAMHEIGLEEASFATKGCNVNYGAACAEVAARYIDGSPVQKDAVKGKQLGEKAVKLLPADCEAGDGRSCTVLGTLYVGRYGARYELPKDATKALDFFKKGCADKDDDACKLVTNFDSLVALKPSGPMHAAHVLVQWAGSTSSKQRRSKADALARAQEAKAKLDAGEDFAAVALAYDDDGARTRGGDLGTFSPGTFPKPFEAAVAGLDIGGVSDIVETSFGFHIIKRLP